MHIWMLHYNVVYKLSYCYFVPIDLIFKLKSIDLKFLKSNSEAELFFSFQEQDLS